MPLTKDERKWVKEQKKAMIRDCRRASVCTRARGLEYPADSYLSWASYKMICLIERLDVTTLDKKYYVNCDGEVIMKPVMRIDKLLGKYIIFDPFQIEHPREFMVVGRNSSWKIKADQ